MKKIGLTGGIGVGKTYVSKIFEQMGIPIFNSDEQAKRCMVEDVNLIDDVKLAFGENIYLRGILQKEVLANIVFKNSNALTKLNALVHPIVKKKFEDWCNMQSTSLVIKEAAILFETGGDKNCNITILVRSPLETRISRVMKRDNISREKLMKRINNQWDDKLKIPLADFVINNINWENTLIEIEAIHKYLIEL
jgi:dephospho-CoA kinase